MEPRSEHIRTCDNCGLNFGIPDEFIADVEAFAKEDGYTCNDCAESHNALTEAYTIEAGYPEVKIFIDYNEIAMIKDFMEKGCAIDNINLEWTDELQSLLESIGHVVCTPEFEKEVWQGHVQPLPKS